MRYVVFIIMTVAIATATVPLRAATVAPRYGVRVEVNVRVPMRDGIKLATDLYFPEGATGKLPAILIRTPYNRKDRTGAARMFAGQGYVVAVQDVRGKFDSEGHFSLSANDTRDGSDTLDWIAAQSWSTGKIGTYGCSYLAEDQLELAKVRNPHHTAMIPQAGGGAYRFADLREGGAVGLAEAAPWFLHWGSKIDPNPAAPKVDLERMFRTLPLVDAAVPNARKVCNSWHDDTPHHRSADRHAVARERPGHPSPKKRLQSWSTRSSIRRFRT